MTIADVNGSIHGDDGRFKNKNHSEPVGEAASRSMQPDTFDQYPLYRLNDNQHLVLLQLSGKVQKTFEHYKQEEAGSDFMVTDWDAVAAERRTLPAVLRKALPNLKDEQFDEHFAGIAETLDKIDRLGKLEQSSEILDDTGLQFEDYDDWVQTYRASDYNLTGGGPDADDPYSEYVDDMVTQAQGELNTRLTGMVRRDITSSILASRPRLNISA